MVRHECSECDETKSAVIVDGEYRCTGCDGAVSASSVTQPNALTDMDRSALAGATEPDGDEDDESEE